MSIFDRKSRALAAAKEAFGPHTWDGKRAAVRHPTGPLWMVLLSANNRADQTLGLCAPLPKPLPIALLVEDRERFSYMGKLAEVKTGDPAFDARFFVAGLPKEVVAAAFDGETRRWMLEVFPKWPSLSLDDGMVWTRMGLSTKVEIQAGAGSEITAHELTSKADGITRLANRLVEAYDHFYGAELARAGPEAANAWHQANIGVVEGEALRRRRRRLMLFAVIGAILCCVLCCPMMFIFGPLFF